MFLEIIKFILYLILIVLVSKYILVRFLRKLAESLNLKPKTVGNIAGFATSVPELLTICTSSLTGLATASIINILSSNVINLLQYLGAVVLNKNTKLLKNKAISTDMIIVIITIILPILLVITKRSLDLSLIPFLIIVYILVMMLNKSMHKLYLKKEDRQIEKEIQKNIKEDIKLERKRKKTFLYCIILIFTCILLFLIGEMLGNTLEILCERFNISQILVGVLLGFFTSMPELITFFEAQRHHKAQNNDTLGILEATNNLMTSNTLNLFVVLTLGIILMTFAK